MSRPQPPNQPHRPSLIGNIPHRTRRQSPHANVISTTKHRERPSANAHQHHEFFES